MPPRMAIRKLCNYFCQDDRVDPSANDNYAIRLASEKGHLEVVEVLLRDKRVNPCSCGKQAIKQASKNGHVEIVRILQEWIASSCWSLDVEGSE